MNSEPNSTVRCPLSRLDAFIENKYLELISKFFTMLNSCYYHFTAPNLFIPALNLWSVVLIYYKVALSGNQIE